MRYNLTQQEKDDYCFCSVLQGILKSHEFYVSQDEIAANLTLAKDGFKVDDGKVEGFLDSFALDYNFYWNNETPFNEPDSLLEEMNEHNGIIGIDTHVYLLDSFNDPNCYLIDPKDNEVVVKDLVDLVQEIGSAGFYAVIKKR